MPEKLQNLHNSPSRGRIESIKSAGERYQKVTSETCPGLFLKKILVKFLLCNMPFDG